MMKFWNFGGMQTELGPISEAISSHCARAWEKLRRQELVAQALFVFVQTNSFREDLPQYCKSMHFKLINPTDDLSLLTKVSKLCLKKLYRRGYQYKKVGVCLEDLIPKNPRQLDIFHQTTDELLASQEKVMRVIEGINHKYGRQTIRLAAEGYSKPWAMRAELKSSAYTTQWSDLPIVKASEFIEG